MAHHLLKSIDWNHIKVAPSVRCGFLRWTKTHYVPSQWFVERVKDFDFLIFSGGHGRLRTKEDEVIELKRGTIVYLRPETMIEAWQEKGKEQIATFYFHHDLLQNGKRLNESSLVGLPLWYETADTNFYETVARKILDLMNPNLLSRHDLLGIEEQKQRQVEAGLLLQSLIFEFIHHSKLAQKLGTRGIHLPLGNLVYDMISRVYQNPENYTTVTELARSVGYSSDHLGRLFRKVIGKSPNQVIVEARVQKAQSLLMTSHFNLSEIAEACGYQNVFYFSTQFKNKIGISPSKFRNQSGRS